MVSCWCSIVTLALRRSDFETWLRVTQGLLLRSVSDKALPIQQFTRNRIGSNKNKSNLDDIINIWTIADEHSIIDKLPCFCAANLSRIPVLNDELADIALIKKTVCDLEKQVRDLSGNLATMKTEYTGNMVE